MNDKKYITFWIKFYFKQLVYTTFLLLLLIILLLLVNLFYDDLWFVKVELVGTEVWWM